MRNRWLIALGIVIVLALIIGAVGRGNKTTVAITPNPVSSTSPTPIDSEEPSAIPTPTASPTPTQALQCNASNLKLSLGSSDGAAGHSYVNLVFTNSSDKTCSLHGNPGVSVVDTTGKQLGNPAGKASGEGATTVSLNSGAVAHATIDFPTPGNFTPGACSAAGTSIKVYAPGDTASQLVATSQQACPGWNVSPVKTGATD